MKNPHYIDIRHRLNLVTIVVFALFQKYRHLYLRFRLPTFYSEIMIVNIFCICFGEMLTITFAWNQSILWCRSENSHFFETQDPMEIMQHYTLTNLYYVFMMTAWMNSSIQYCKYDMGWNKLWRYDTYVSYVSYPHNGEESTQWNVFPKVWLFLTGYGTYETYVLYPWEHMFPNSNFSFLASYWHFVIILRLYDIIYRINKSYNIYIDYKITR